MEQKTPKKLAELPLKINDLAELATALGNTHRDNPLSKSLRELGRDLRGLAYEHTSLSEGQMAAFRDLLKPSPSISPLEVLQLKELGDAIRSVLKLPGGQDISIQIEALGKLAKLSEVDLAKTLEKLTLDARVTITSAIDSYMEDTSQRIAARVIIISTLNEQGLMVDYGTETSSIAEMQQKRAA